MSTNHDFERSISAWLVAQVPERASERLLETSRQRIGVTLQRRAWWPAWRFNDVNTYARLAVAAAAVLVIALVSIDLLTGSGAPGTGGPMGSPSPSPTPDTSERPSPPAASPSVSSPSIAPASPAIPSPLSSYDAFPGPGGVGAGRYTATVGDVRVRFDVVARDWGSGVWGVIRGPASFQESLGFYSPDQVGIRECDSDAHRPVGSTVADLAEAISALPGIRVTGPSATTVGGVPATHLDVAFSGCPVTQAIDCGDGTPCTVVGYLWGREGDVQPLGAGLGHAFGADGGRILLWILEVDGTRVVIEADLDPSEGPAFEEDVRRLVESITFE